jgi:hypothetical protein
MFAVVTGGAGRFPQLYAAGYMVRAREGALLDDYDSQTCFQNQMVSPADITLLVIKKETIAPTSMIVSQCRQ